MGNFSSCIAGFDPISSPPPKAVHTRAHVTRVLLVDGSMLIFKAPIKVIKLLLDYPNHLICPLDSLAPGLHSLSSLPPDEKLQLGKLYLLLPFKTNVQDSCIKSEQGLQQKGDPSKAFAEAQAKGERTRLRAGANPDVDLANSTRFYKKGDVGLHGKLQSASLVQQGEHGCKKNPGKVGSTTAMGESEEGSKECAELTKDGDIGPHSRRHAGAPASYRGRLAERRRGRREMQHSKSNIDANYIKEEGQCTSTGSIKPAYDINYGVSPLCDTPELQKAYRSLLLRRSCSWTPRLQPILERR